MMKTLIPNAIDGPHSVEGVCRSCVNFATLAYSLVN